MKRHPLTLDQLRAYCEKHAIAVPKGARREALEAAITLALLHCGEPEPDPEIGCFGHHDGEDGNCLTCVFKDDCAEVTLGMPRAKYDRFIERLENPRLSFVPLRKKKKRAKLK